MSINIGALRTLAIFGVAAIVIALFELAFKLLK